jgi:pimeloyl-ACP methyl ester carboxylesterase
MVTQQSIVLTDATPTGEGTRSADGIPTVELQVPDPGEGFAQVAMTRDASGRISWHFAPDLDPAEATRDGSVPTLRTRTFTFPTTPTTVEGERGVVSAIAQKLINVYAFPVGKKIIGTLTAKYGERIELERTPYRVRPFLPSDYTSDTTAPITEGDWQRLASGRALLMIHGTNSRTHTAFGGLPRAFVEAMHAQYEGRVFAFDHPTITHTPKQNIETLLDAMPDGLSLDVDIICHSRGGLVSRVLAEKQEELHWGRRTVRVGSVVFVGAPNAGTRLADEAFISEYLDTITNLLNVVPTNGVTDALGFVLTGVKLVATGLWAGLKGLHSMQPEGEFGRWLNSGERLRETRYFALASDYTPTHQSLKALAADTLMDKVFKGARNDLVVPTDGVYADNGSKYFPIAGEVVFSAADGVPHTGFFQYPKTTELITAWLRS